MVNLPTKEALVTVTRFHVLRYRAAPLATPQHNPTGLSIKPTSSASLSSAVTRREENTTGSTPVREHRDSTKSSPSQPFKHYYHMVVLFSYPFSVVRIRTELV
jgi:hypothetical protein